MEAPIEIGASIREKGRMSSIGYLFGQGFGLLIDGFDGLGGLSFVIDDFAGGKLGFELFDNLSMHLLVDLHLEGEHQQAEHDQNERHIEGADFRRVWMFAGVISAAVALPVIPAATAMKPVMPFDRAPPILSSIGRTDRVTASLRLPFLSWPYSMESVRDRIAVILDERARYVEEHQQNVSDNHGDHAADIQVAARDTLVQNRVQRSHDQADLSQFAFAKASSTLFKKVFSK